MKPKTAKVPPKLEIGAVVEVPTARGFAYLQYTHWNDLMGALVRVLPRLYMSRPVDLQALVDEPESYVTFAPVREAINAGIFDLVGHAEVPERARKFPLFRAAGARAVKTGEARNWWLWDGKNEWRLDALSPDQAKLPIRSTIMPPVLIRRLEAGWHPGDPDPTTDGVPGEGGDVREPQVRHYLYFRDERTARRAAASLSEDGLSSEVEESARGADWLVRVSAGQDRAEEAKARLENIARQLHGEYDGWDSG